MAELLMRDVSSAFLRDSDPISADQHEMLLDAMAQLHAATQGMVDDPADIEKGMQDAKVRSALVERIRAEAMNATLGNDVRYRVVAQDDHQIQEGLRLFDRATQLLARREGMLLGGSTGTNVAAANGQKK